MTEITKIAVSFHWDTCSAFFTLSCRAAAVTNCKMVLQKVVGDPEQKLVGLLLNLKLIVEFYTVLKGKIYCKHHDTFDME